METKTLPIHKIKEAITEEYPKGRGDQTYKIRIHPNSEETALAIFEGKDCLLLSVDVWDGPNPLHTARIATIRVRIDKTGEYYEFEYNREYPYRGDFWKGRGESRVMKLIKNGVKAFAAGFKKESITLWEEENGRD